MTGGNYLSVDVFDELVNLVGDARHQAVCVAAANRESGRGRRYARHAFIKSSLLQSLLPSTLSASSASSAPPGFQQCGKGK